MCFRRGRLKRERSIFSQLERHDRADILLVRRETNRVVGLDLRLHPDFVLAMNIASFVAIEPFFELF